MNEFEVRYDRKDKRAMGLLWRTNRYIPMSLRRKVCDKVSLVVGSRMINKI